MKKSLLLVFLTSSFAFFLSWQGLAQVNEYSLIPVDLEIGPGDSIVQVNVNIKTFDNCIEIFRLPLFAEGSCNPVLDTVLTGGLNSAIAPAYYEPSLAAGFTEKGVNPYGPPTAPMFFWAFDTNCGVVYPTEGLFCRMFYRVSGPGTLTFRTAVHPTAGPVQMINPSGPLPINWPDSGEVGSFEITADAQRGDANYDGKLTVADIVYLISYLFKGGPPPFVSEAGDFNCDGQITVTDVILLLNYLFKGGPPSPC